ncbi:MAG: hypothetical protein EON96_06230 [Caulobacteraceae bacterium]|nr:MAG: hypothetical protein EON96_06230 [Caulobacteraceae bacterium]
MADAKTPAEETPHFETDTVQADRAREQGLGLGERELQAQRDPGGVRTPDVDDGEEETDIDDGALTASNDRTSDTAP